MFVRRDDDDGLAHGFGLNGCNHGGTGAAIDDDVVVLSGSREGEDEGTEKGAHDGRSDRG